jgi:hypothetical protein
MVKPQTVGIRRKVQAVRCIVVFVVTAVGDIVFCGFRKLLAELGVNAVEVKVAGDIPLLGQVGNGDVARIHCGGDVVLDGKAIRNKYTDYGDKKYDYGDGF